MYSSRLEESFFQPDKEIDDRSNLDAIANNLLSTYNQSAISGYYLKRDRVAKESQHHLTRQMLGLLLGSG